MPPYCEPEDLERYGINREALKGLSTEENIRPAIDFATAKVDSYLRNQFTLPLQTVGVAIKSATAIIAAHRALSVRGMMPGADDPLQLAYDETLSWLKLVATGTVVPDVVDSDPGAGAVWGDVGIARITSNEQRGYQSSDGRSGVAFTGRRRR